MPPSEFIKRKACVCVHRFLWSPDTPFPYHQLQALRAHPDIDANVAPPPHLEGSPCAWPLQQRRSIPSEHSTTPLTRP